MYTIFYLKIPSPLSPSLYQRGGELLFRVGYRPLNLPRVIGQPSFPSYTKGEFKRGTSSSFSISPSPYKERGITGERLL